MTVITLTGHLGSMGNIATIVARSLGYRLVDREIVREAAEALHWDEDTVEAFDEKTGGLGRRLLEFFERGLGNIAVHEAVGAFGMSYGLAAANSPSDLYLDTLTTMVESLADQGDVVIVGRGGQAILAGRPDTLHVRVACPTDERIRRIAARAWMNEAAAAEHVRTSDREREAWHQKYFGIDYRSPYNYALVVNSGVLSDDLAAGLIRNVVFAHEEHRSEDGRLTHRAPTPVGYPLR